MMSLIRSTSSSCGSVSTAWIESQEVDGALHQSRPVSNGFSRFASGPERGKDESFGTVSKGDGNGSLASGLRSVPSTNSSGNAVELGAWADHGQVTVKVSRTE